MTVTYRSHDLQKNNNKQKQNNSEYYPSILQLLISYFYLFTLSLTTYLDMWELFNKNFMLLHQSVSSDTA